MAPRTAGKPIVLLCEDDRFAREHIAEILADAGYEVLSAATETATYEVLKARGPEIDVAIVDVHLPKTESPRDSSSESGRRAGMRVARFIRDRSLEIRVIGTSGFSDPETRDWFSDNCFAYMHKTFLMSRQDAIAYALPIIGNAARKRYRQIAPSSFIVHGHDSVALDDLKVFIRKKLKWRKPKVLRELPSGGKTIIEKFEDAARKVDAVFVLLTPDDRVAAKKAPDDLKRRARQNVIFEMGYFFGKMQRAGGRIFLLHHGKVELPSDIHGIVYIDISKGIEAAGDDIRREVKSILPRRA